MPLKVQRAILYLQPDADLSNVNYRRLFSDAPRPKVEGSGL